MGKEERVIRGGEKVGMGECGWRSGEGEGRGRMVKEDGEAKVSRTARARSRHERGLRFAEKGLV